MVVGCGYDGGVVIRMTVILVMVACATEVGQLSFCDK